MAIITQGHIIQRMLWAQHIDELGELSSSFWECYGIRGTVGDDDPVIQCAN